MKTMDDYKALLPWNVAGTVVMLTRKAARGNNALTEYRRLQKLWRAWRFERKPVCPNPDIVR